MRFLALYFGLIALIAALVSLFLTVWLITKVCKDLRYIFLRYILRKSVESPTSHKGEVDKKDGIPDTYSGILKTLVLCLVLCVIAAALAYLSYSANDFFGFQPLDTDGLGP